MADDEWVSKNKRGEHVLCATRTDVSVAAASLIFLFSSAANPGHLDGGLAGGGGRELNAEACEVECCGGTRESCASND